MAESKPSLNRTLNDHKIVLCCGSGGVGKTSTAASLALFCSEQEKKTACLTIDPARRLLDTIGQRQLGGRNEYALSDPPLHFFMVDPTTIISRFSEKLRESSAIFNNDIFRDALNALAGAQEFLALRDLYLLTVERDFDKIIVDTPPTKNALSFLSAPKRLLDFLRNSQRIRSFFQMAFASQTRTINPFKIGVKTVIQAFDRVIGITPLKRLLDFGGAIDEIIDQKYLKANVEQINELLHSDQTGYVIITTPTYSNIKEALYFKKKLKEKKLRFCGFIINKVFPETGQENAAIDFIGQQPQVLSGTLRNLYHESTAIMNHERALIDLVHNSLDPDEFLHVLPLLEGDIVDLESLDRLAQSIHKTETTG